MTTFHSLTVAKVEPETRDAVIHYLCGTPAFAGGVSLSVPVNI